MNERKNGGMSAQLPWPLLLTLVLSWKQDGRPERDVTTRSDRDAARSRAGGRTVISNSLTG